MKVLVTGGGGFLAAWLVRRLLKAGHQPVIFDLSDDRRFHRDTIQDAAADLEWIVGDITSAEDVSNAMSGRDRVVHLAGVQTPFCKDKPIAGAMINVIGTLNVFEAARQQGIDRIIYTSSGGAFGIPSPGEPVPITHYGVYKLANEGNARTYWYENGMSSIGFRPFIVYGKGRDAGLTACVTQACRAAAQGEPFNIPLTGPLAMVYVDDVAAACAAAVEVEFSGAHTINLPGTQSTIETVVALIKSIVPDARITCSGETIPSISDVENNFETPLLGLGAETELAEGLRRTIELYRED